MLAPISKDVLRLPQTSTVRATNPANLGIACPLTSTNIRWQPIERAGIFRGVGGVTGSDTPKMLSSTVIRSTKRKEKSDKLMAELEYTPLTLGRETVMSINRNAKSWLNISAYQNHHCLGEPVLLNRL